MESISKEGVYIDKVEGTRAVILYSRVGRRVPLHCSAVGKVLAAYQREEELQKILHRYEYRRQTPNTICSETDFLAELRKVRTETYAVDHQENEPGVRCIAVPLRDHTGKVIAAISMSTLISQVRDQELKEFVAILMDASAIISRQMGFKEPK